MLLEAGKMDRDVAMIRFRRCWECMLLPKRLVDWVAFNLKKRRMTVKDPPWMIWMTLPHLSRRRYIPTLFRGGGQWY